MFDSNGESGPPCRSSFRARTHYAACHHPRLQVSANQARHSLVADSTSQPRHQHVVIDSVKELLQIHIHDPAPPFSHVRARLRNRLLRAAARTKAVARFGKARLKQRTHHLMQCLLYEPIQDRRNAQLTHSARGLRNLHASHRLRLAPAIQQAFFDLRPMLLQVRHQLLDRHFVNAWRSLVAHHPRVSIEQVLTRDHCFHQLQIFRSDGFSPCRAV